MEKKPNKKKIYNNHAPILIDSSEHSDSDSNYQPEPSPKPKSKPKKKIKCNTKYQ